MNRTMRTGGMARNTHRPEETGESAEWAVKKGFFRDKILPYFYSEIKVYLTIENASKMSQKQKADHLGS
jgi:hypothetical protein